MSKVSIYKEFLVAAMQKKKDHIDTAEGIKTSYSFNRALLHLCRHSSKGQTLEIAKHLG